ncbi:MAG: hypothetical protein AB7H80_01920 [Candidatus Kapaibacterium sp.]
MRLPAVLPAAVFIPHCFILSDNTSVAQRGAEQLREVLLRLEASEFKVGTSDFSPDQIDIIEDHTKVIGGQAGKPT